MEAMVAVDQNWAIGLGGEMQFRISADLRRFREMTMGGTVICGRKTLATFPHGRPLPGRENIILSQNPWLHIPGAVVCHSMEEVLAAVKHRGKVFVIGGGIVYRAFLPFCTRVYVTKVLAARSADCWFPDLDADSHWLVADQSPILRENGLEYQYVTYEAATKPAPA